MQCAIMRCKHLQDQLTDRLTALWILPKDDSPIGSREEEKCRLMLVETCDTAHPKRQNAAERGKLRQNGRKTRQNGGRMQQNSSRTRQNGGRMRQNAVKRRQNMAERQQNAAEQRQLESS